MVANAENPNLSVSDTINFSMTTTALDCDPSAEAPNTCSAPNNGVPWEGEGHYSISGGCTYISDGTGAGENSSESGNCTLSSSGVYESVYCGGTGELSGTATWTPSPANPTEGGTISYNIDFIAGIGTFDPDAAEATGVSGDTGGAEEFSGEVANSVTENETSGSQYTAFLNPDPAVSNALFNPGAPGAPGSGICALGFNVSGTAEIDEGSTAP
jgi:hypothetical protein